MEVFTVAKSLISAINSMFKTFRLIIPRIKNSLLRPRLNFELKHQRVMFKGDDNKEHWYPYFCLLISNFTKYDYHLNPNKISINNERYIVMIQMESNFLRLNPEAQHSWKECGSDIYPLYKENWGKIAEGNFYFLIKPYETKIFPLKPISAASHLFTSTKKDSLLFFPKNNISITLEVNRKIYEYGICRKYCYERLINYLAFFHEVPF